MAHEEVKYFEIRDRGTCIPAMAVRFVATVRDEDYLLRRSGYGVGQPYVLLAKIASGRCQSHYDPYDWNCRTMTTAHIHITNDWQDLASGAAIDAEFIRGESASPKQSERFPSSC